MNDLPSYTLIDVRGFLIRDIMGSQYKSEVDSNGDTFASWQDGLAAFVSKTLMPLLESGAAAPSIIACWDGGNSYRLGKFAGYKKRRLSREKTAEQKANLKVYFEQAKRLLAYLGIKSVMVPGEEADDLIALLHERLDYSAMIVHTVDQDMLQLVDERTHVLRNNTLYSQDNADFDGCPVSLIRLYKAFVGDSSDEYPGIAGFGPKSFQKLLEAYGEDGLLQIAGCLDGPACQVPWQPVQDAFDATQDPLLKKILEHWSEARLFYDIAGLHPEVCYGTMGTAPKRPEWTARIPDAGRVSGILGLLGLQHLIPRLYELELFPRHRLVTADQANELVALAGQIAVSPIRSWDYESSDKLQHPGFKEAKKRSGGRFVDVLSQELAGVSINYGDHLQHTIYVPVDHKDTANFDKGWVKWLLDVVDSGPDRSIVQNANFELTVSETNLGARPQAPYDTQIMASYVDEGLESHLKGMSQHWLGYRQATYEEVTGGRAMCELTGKEVLSYGCDDSLVTSHLFNLFRLIMQCEGTWEFYSTCEVEPALDDVTSFVLGTPIDFELLDKQRKEAAAEVKRHTAELRAVLAAHCTDPSQEVAMARATTLFQEWWAEAKFRYPRADQAEKAQALYESLWARAWNGCFYQKRTERIEAPVFVSTPTMLNQVLGALDPRVPKILKATGPGVVEWESRLRETKGWPEEVEAFAHLLWKAQKDLGAAKRSGDAYLELAVFCEDVLAQAGAGKKVAEGDELNLGSTVQMQALLYLKLGLPVRKRSKVTRGSLRDRMKLPGAPGTGLKAIAAAIVYDVQDREDWRHGALMNYRQIALNKQAESLFYRPYPLWVHPRDGMIHPQIRNCGTATRRPSGSDPNVLQVSKKDDSALRKVFVAGPYPDDDGPRVVVSADYSNQELVITACESKDPTMLAAFQSSPRKDIHSLTSTGYAHILLPRLGYRGPAIDTRSYEGFMAARRSAELGEGKSNLATRVRNEYSKAVNFLIAYGGGYTTLAGNLLIPPELAKELMNSTFRLYGRLKLWQQETIQLALSQGYTETAYGNRRHATKDLWSSDDSVAHHEQRALVNATIQGTAADILKVVRQEMVRRKMVERYALRAVKPVYDEMTASVPIDRAVDYAEELVEVMTITPPGYPVGMQVEVSIGLSWGDQVELGVFNRQEAEELIARLKEKVSA